MTKILDIGGNKNLLTPEQLDGADNPSDIEFWTSVKVEDVVEVAELVVKNDGWQPGRGEKWARVDGCLIFRRGTTGKVRTTWSREQVMELIADNPTWITVPYTIRDPHMV